MVERRRPDQYRLADDDAGPEGRGVPGDDPKAGAVLRPLRRSPAGRGQELMPVTHTFVSAIADGADATLVRPTNWNADHAFPDKNVFLQGPGSVTLATTGIMEQPVRLTLASTDRLTESGTARLILSDSVFDPSVVKFRAPGSYTVQPDEYVPAWDRFDLRGNARVTMNGTA